jgi:hypothetical protein
MIPVNKDVPLKMLRNLTIEEACAAGDEAGRVLMRHFFPSGCVFPENEQEDDGKQSKPGA